MEPSLSLSLNAAHTYTKRGFMHVPVAFVRNELVLAAVERMRYRKRPNLILFSTIKIVKVMLQNSPYFPFFHKGKQMCLYSLDLYDGNRWQQEQKSNSFGWKLLNMIVPLHGYVLHACVHLHLHILTIFCNL